MKKDAFVTPAIGFIFLIGISFMGYFTIMRGRSYDLERGSHIPVILNKAEGIKTGAAVLVSGVRMGVVSSLHLIRTTTDGNFIAADGEEDGRYAVLLILDMLHEIPIYANYRIITRNTTLISPKIVEILPGRLEKSAKGHISTQHISTQHISFAEVLRFRSSGKLPFRIVDKPLLRAVNSDDPLYLMSGIIEDNRRNIFQITRNLVEITSKMDRGKGLVAAILNRNVLHKETIQAIYLLRILLNEIRELAEDSRESKQLVAFLSVFLSLALRAALGGAP